MTLIKITLRVIEAILWCCFSIAFCLLLWKGFGIVISAGVFNILIGAIIAAPIAGVCYFKGIEKGIFH